MILLIDAAGGSVEGRTTLQKWLYFASVKTGLNLGFIPHFYGPFSDSVSRTIYDLIASDFLVESGRVTRYDRVIYTYTLTEDGKNIAKDLKRSNEALYRKLKEVVDTCNNVVGNNISILSWAAKTYYLLHRQSKKITYAEIRKTARSLGWQLSDTEIDSGVKLLSALRLAKKND
jgi:uncharacterized protein YwgA